MRDKANTKTRECGREEAVPATAKPYAKGSLL